MNSPAKARHLAAAVLVACALLAGGGPALGDPDIRSAVALVIDHNGNRLYSRNPTEVRPIASITKLMTAMVVLDADVPLDDPVIITEQDRDRMRWSRSRLYIDEATLSRRDMLRVALMSSDNRAAHALGRTTFAGGTESFVDAMNVKARILGMRDSHFADTSGLDAGNVSTAEDLVRLIHAAAQYPFIREVTSAGEYTAHPYIATKRGPLHYRNTNPLTRDARWQVELSKTGYIHEAGRCLVMQAVVAGRRLYIVLLNAQGKLTPMADSQRLRDWLRAHPDTRTASVAGSG